MVISNMPMVETRPQGPGEIQVSPRDQLALLGGEVLLDLQAPGGAVTARMYVPLERPQVWPQLTQYGNWTQFFPNIVHSEVLETFKVGDRRHRRLYQVGRKGFMLLTAEVDIVLQVVETPCHHIQFRLERGTFAHFAADLSLQDLGPGTVVSYSVQATPTIPVPNFLVEQAMKTDLPSNMRQMRQVLCRRGQVFQNGPGLC